MRVTGASNPPRMYLEPLRNFASPPKQHLLASSHQSYLTEPGHGLAERKRFGGRGDPPLEPLLHTRGGYTPAGEEEALGWEGEWVGGGTGGATHQV